MKSELKIPALRLAILTAAAVAMATSTTSALAQAAQPAPVPQNWKYEIRDGKRIPKNGNRVVKPDGSWREEIRQGKCITVKERSAAGEYRETRQCDGS